VPSGRVSTAEMARAERLGRWLVWAAPGDGATAAYNQEFEARMAASTRLSTWLGELRRRRVVRVALAYLIAAWVLIQIAAETFEPLGLPDWALKLVIMVAVLGLPVAMMLAWAFDVTPRGIERTAPADPGRPAPRARSPVRLGKCGDMALSFHNMTLVILPMLC
jgi:hypothetical protein